MLCDAAMRCVAFSSAVPLFIAAGLAGCAAQEPEARTVCDDVADLAAECTGVRPELPAEGCVGAYRDGAEAVLAQGCDALTTVGITTQDASPWCDPALTWTGVCAPRPLADVAALASLGEVCPPDRADELCAALRAADFGKARAAAAGAVAAGALTDPAVRYYLRERTMALVVWNALTDRGRTAPPADYARAAGAWLDAYFPAYQGDASQFAMARQPLAPSGAACASPSSGDVIVIFPGVVRLEDRSEFAKQTEAIRDVLPCVRTIVLDTGNFVDPKANAALASRTLAAAAPAPAALHFIGYSQGSTNVLRTLVDYPEIAARVRTVLTMNSAAHGSEIVDVLLPALDNLDADARFCDKLPDYARPTCEWAAEQSPKPARVIMEEIARSMGIPVDSLDGWLDPNDRTTTLRDFLKEHVPGVRSLTTVAAAEFWATRAHQLPRTALYTSFRSAITDPDRNLPASNALFYGLLNRAGGDAPYNDMQVLLTKQSLGGPIADLETILPVAEGNHWQWQYTAGQMDERLMPADMTARIPQLAWMVGYAETLHDLGVLAR